MKRTYYLNPFIIECGGRDFLHICFIISANKSKVFHETEREAAEAHNTHSIELRDVEKKKSLKNKSNTKRLPSSV